MENEGLNWFLWGIGPLPSIQSHNYQTWSCPHFCGHSNNSQGYFDGNNRDIQNTEHYKQKQCEVDIYLNVDEGVLKTSVVGESEEAKEVTFSGLSSINNDFGWVPVFNFGTGAFQTKIRFARIPDSWYGVKKNIHWTPNKPLM